jgi:hypothetical protein
MDKQSELKSQSPHHRAKVCVLLRLNSQQLKNAILIAFIQQVAGD